MLMRSAREPYWNGAQILDWYKSVAGNKLAAA